MWAAAMYWSSLPSVPMLRALAHGIILPLDPPHRPTLGLISFAGIQLAPHGIVTMLTCKGNITIKHDAQILTRGIQSILDKYNTIEDAYVPCKGDPKRKL